MDTTTVGADLAKDLITVCVQDRSGRTTECRDLRRASFGPWLAQLPPGCVVGMEACSAAHFWARHMRSLGLDPRIMAAEFGLSLARSSAALRKGLALASQDESLPHTVRAMATEVREHLEGLDERIARRDREIAQACRADPAARRLQDVTGVGPTSADALVATVGNARDFRNGRQFAA